MPLFFILSGFLWNNNRNSIQYLILIELNWKRYIVPYVILCVVNLFLHFAVFLVMGYDYNWCRYIFGILYSRGTTVWMPNCSPLWFLTAIFVAMCIFDSIQRMEIKGYKKHLIIGVMGICSLLLSYFEAHKLPWNMDTAMMAVVFVMFGQLMKEYELLPRIKRMLPFVKLLFLLLLIICGIVAILANPVKNVSFDNNQYGNVAFMLVGALSICLVFFYICYSIDWNGKVLVASVLSFFGRHTIFIMGFDYFAIFLTECIAHGIIFFNWRRLFALKIAILAIGIMTWNCFVEKIGNNRIRHVLYF